MSRDDSIGDRFKRAREAHRKRDEQRRTLADLHRERVEAVRMHHGDRSHGRQHGKPPLDVAAIAAAALAIADAQGLEEVSMRKIAAVLGSGTMSLYHYVRTKDDLFAAMDDLIMGEILVPPRELKGTWRHALSAIARHTRDAYRRHPWALTLQSRGRPGINGVKHVEQSLVALSSTGLGFDDRMSFIILVDDFVFGHSLRAREQRAGADERGSMDSAAVEKAFGEVADFMSGHLRSGEFPELTKMIGDNDPLVFMKRMAEGFDPDEWFEIGLESILDGLARHYGLDT